MGRRGSGEGSIFERADGRWCAHLIVGPERQRRYLYGRTRQEAARKLMARSRDDGPLPAPGRGTVGSYLIAWLEGQRSRLRPRVWLRYEQLVHVHALPFLGRIPLDRLAPQDLAALHANRLGAA